MSHTSKTYLSLSQGQTFDKVGIYLPRPCFSHGQLYVAMSRVGSPSCIKIMALSTPNEEGAYTVNVVYKEVFNENFIPDRNA